MSGGGSRFGYYLGWYSAAQQLNQQPDLILASCGGAIAAGLIACSESSEQALELLMSKKMYQMQQRFIPHQAINSYLQLAQAIRRFVCSYLPCQAKTIDLHKSALFEISGDEPLFPFQAINHKTNPDIAIVGAKLRALKHSFEQTLFCNERTALLTQGMKLPKKSPFIETKLFTQTQCPLQQAIAISMADIFYLPPHQWHSEHYIYP